VFGKQLKQKILKSACEKFHDEAIFGALARKYFQEVVVSPEISLL
jgi:hypothetical protein